MNANAIAVRMAGGESVMIHGKEYCFCDFISGGVISSRALLAALYGTIKPLEDFINTELVKWVENLIENKGVSMSGNIAKATEKERADKLRIEIMNLSDSELTYANSEAFGTSFQTLPELIVSMSEKAKKELPF